MTIVRVFVPIDAAALSVGADDVAVDDFLDYLFGQNSGFFLCRACGQNFFGFFIIFNQS